MSLVVRLSSDEIARTVHKIRDPMGRELATAEDAEGSMKRGEDKPGGLQLKPSSLENDVYVALRERILRGDLISGDPLVEAQLSAQFGISKTPVREALIRLKRDGLVESAQHRVTRVATPTAADIRDACEVRAWIETQLAVTHAKSDSENVLEKLGASITDAQRALDADDDHAYVAALRSFSDVLAEGSGNRFAVQVLDRLRNVLALIGNVSRTTPGRRQRSIAEHRAILEAIAAGDPEAAAAATNRHIHSIEHDSLDVLSQLPAGAA